MSADLQATEQNEPTRRELAAAPPQPTEQPAEAEAGDDSDADDEDDEPKLKYAKLTGSLTNVYRNGDSTSAFIVAGDRMALGTHNGNIHVVTLPTLQSLRTYHAHSATITSLSISPTPPPPSVPSKVESGRAKSKARSPTSSIFSGPSSSTTASFNPRAQRPQQQTLPNTPSNAIYIATSSLDGHVCISSLLDPKDVQLRNFARPVQAVALSPRYKSDRTYLSGGLAGQLILTVGGKAGVTTDANTNFSAATATSGFLGAFGLGTDRGKDTALHSGEGAISCIKWSWSEKWVVWINEAGIKIMRSHLKLGSEDEEDAWRRIAHVPRPNKRGWEEMAGVWKGRAEWIDERKLEEDDVHKSADSAVNGVNGTDAKKPKSGKGKVETLVVGWGNTAWILHVTEGAPATPTPGSSGKKIIGTAPIIHKLLFDDCIISGISLYTPSLLAILAYRTHDDDNNPIQQPNSNSAASSAQTKPARKGRHNRQTGLAPQLRLVHVRTGIEDEVDELSISRFETLSAQDYHLGTLFIPHPSAKDQQVTEKGALEGIWEGTRNATRIFSSAASVRSSRSSEGQSLENGGGGGKASLTSPSSSAVGVPLPLPAGRRIGIADAHPFAASAGLKLLIQSPYDCVLAVKTDLKDHLDFLLQQEAYQQAWELVDRHPGIVDASAAPVVDRRPADSPSSPASHRSRTGSLFEFFANDAASQRSSTGGGGGESAAVREKRRIGERLLQQLISADRWEEAGKAAGKVIDTSRKWEQWVFAFAQAGKFDEITPYLPTDAHLPGRVYEVVLANYISTDLRRFGELLEAWAPDRGLYDVESVLNAVKNRFENDDVEEGSEEWKILMEALAKLYLADGHARDALRCYIQVQNAEKAMDLIREGSLVDMIDADDVPGLLMLKVSREQMRSAPLNELEEASDEVVKLLVESALNGTLTPTAVIHVLEGRGRAYRPFLYFYLRSLWFSTDGNKAGVTRRGKAAVQSNQGHTLVEDHADLAVELFAEYDRELLEEFLEKSEVYNYEKAAAICEQRNYVHERVYVLAKMGQTKDALMLIINEENDVKWAIEFTKKHPDLWGDLLDYSMDKPAFIRGLLEEAGMAIDPIQLIRRIPERLRIDGLKEGIAKMMKDYDIQYSISEGVAKVLRGEVTMGMDTLRAGQRKGVKFEVVHDTTREIELTVVDPPTKAAGETLPVAETKVEKKEAKKVEPGHCVGCSEAFNEDEKEILIGFACGHVYHLSCLLKLNPATSDPNTISRLLSQLGSGDTNEERYTGRSVGGKVAHAHIIKNVLQGGCQHCTVPEGA